MLENIENHPVKFGKTGVLIINLVPLTAQTFGR